MLGNEAIVDVFCDTHCYCGWASGARGLSSASLALAGTRWDPGEELWSESGILYSTDHARTTGLLFREQEGGQAGQLAPGMGVFSR